MNVNKKIAAAAVAGVALVSLTACNDTPQSNANQTESKQASTGETNLLTSQPVHAYSYSQLRKNLQELEDAQANGTVTTSFFYNQGVQNPIFSCPSIGAPIASTDELTNPQQAVTNDGNQSSYATSIGQMDPTGVYTGDSTGTYVMCVAKDGSVNPVYWEGFVSTVFGPAHWDDNAKQIVIDGPSGSHFTGLNK